MYEGPWDLPGILEGHEPYGVQILPAEQNHQTISGPDNYVIFNNGSAHVNAAFAFLTWLSSPQTVLKWSTATGQLPIRRDVAKLPGYSAFVAKYPGVGVWAANLANAEQARPTIASYSKISTVVGQAVQLPGVLGRSLSAWRWCRST
jgi:multiple sugar transport system substrate-binding protein